MVKPGAKITVSLNFDVRQLRLLKLNRLIKPEKFEIGQGPPPADRRLLENEHGLGMRSWHRRVARRAGHWAMIGRWRQFLGKAAESTEYCDLCVMSLNIEN